MVNGVIGSHKFADGLIKDEVDIVTKDVFHDVVKQDVDDMVKNVVEDVAKDFVHDEVEQDVEDMVKVVVEKSVKKLVMRSMLRRTSTSGNIGPALRARRKWVYNVPRRTGHAFAV